MELNDALTGLLKFEVLEQRIHKQLSECLTANLPFSIIMADLDHFKKVNDSYGHEFGNKVLKSVSDIVLSVTHGKGSAFRYGGEEITILLPNHSVQEAIAVGERIRKAIESSPVEDKMVTISIGVSMAPDHSADPKELIDLADKALYTAKDRGRNLVRVYGEPEPLKPRERETERKQAEAGKLTQEQRSDIKQQHFRGYAVRCPEDNALLKVIVLQVTPAQKSQGIKIRCPLCGLNELIP